MAGLVLSAVPLLGQDNAKPGKPVQPTVKCSDKNSRDQDDMCIWVHPTDPSQSTIIASDKHANRLFVYDLQGKTIQSVPAKHPGNIDLRYGFSFGEAKADVVAFDQRDDPRVIVYRVDAKTRQLQRVDNDAIRNPANYGGTLFKSPKTGKLYFFTTSYPGNVDQYELTLDSAGKVAGKKVRGWKIGLCEAAVGDDEHGKVYIAEEGRGVWEVDGEPDAPTPGKLVIKVGERGLRGDVEGLAIYHVPDGAGYLLVSNQGSNNFKVYERTGAHTFLGTFTIQGAVDSDGLDVCNADLGRDFPKGMFACHTGDRGCPVLLTPWDAIARAVPPGLKVDTSWRLRK